MADYLHDQPSASTSRLASGTMADTQRHVTAPSASDSGRQYNDNNMATNRTAVRARARSIGTDKRAALLRTTSSFAALPRRRESNIEEEYHHLTDGFAEGHGGVAWDERSAAATPDFTVESAHAQATDDRGSSNVSGGTAYDLARNWRGKQRADAAAELQPTLMSPSVPSPASPRSRLLTNPMRSLMTSFSNAEVQDKAAGATTNSTEAKARHSGDRKRLGGVSSLNRFQGLTASARSLANISDGTRSVPSTPSTNWVKRLQLPKLLAMPAARQASPSGLAGFNDDSPPLTPTSSEHVEEFLGHAANATDGDADDTHSDFQRGGDVRHTAHPLWSSADRSTWWTPYSSSTTMSSGRLSPMFSLFSSSTSESASPLSRPSSITSVSKSSAPAAESLLPRHYLSPPGSPEPTSSVRRSHKQALATSWHNASTAALKALSSRFSASRTQMPPLRPHFPAMLFFLTAFIGSTACVILALLTLPLHLPNHITDLTLAEIRDMSISLREYSRSDRKAFAHTLAVLGFFFTWKQSFTIPGSLIMNVVFGAMYGTLFGTLYTSMLTAVGGVFCYLLMAPLGPLVGAMPGLNKGLDKIRHALRGGVEAKPNKPIRSQSSPLPSLTQSSTERRASLRTSGRLTQPRPAAKASFGKGVASGSNLWSYLLVLRLLPVVPYGLMNIACSVLRVPLVPYAVTLAIGSIPWNACTVQIGDLLVEVASALDAASSGNETLGSTAALVDQMEAAGFHNAPRPGSGSIGPAPLVSPAITAFEKATAIKGHAQTGIQAITAKIWNREMMVKLILMSLVSLAPLLLQRWLKARRGANGPGANEIDDVEDGDVYEEYADEGDAGAHDSMSRMLHSKRMGALDEANAVEMGTTDSAADVCSPSPDTFKEHVYVTASSPLAATPRSTVATHTRSRSLRHNLAGLSMGQQPRFKRAVAKVFN